MTRYTFDEVRSALAKAWGFGLARGSEDRVNGKHDGRWDVTHSKTGFVVSGQFPGHRYGHRRYRSLSDIVRLFELKKTIAELRA